MLQNFLSQDFIFALAWTLTHALWQIALVAVGLMFVLRINKSLKPQNKYLISLSALAICCVVALATFCIYYVDHYNGAMLSNSPGLLTGQLTSDVSDVQLATFILDDKYVLAIVNAWIIGSILYFLRFLGGYIYIKRMAKTAICETSPSLIKKLTKLRRKYQISREVIIRSSGKITTPMVMGFLKPVILFPIGMLNNLSSEEVSAILAHELAHIKRHDYLINILQSIIEVIFYFHPGIWYISSCINRERENCCDDLAIEQGGNVISYAKTLVKLQEMKGVNLLPALSIKTNNSQFAARIKRILNVPVAKSWRKEKFFILLFICFGFFAFSKQQDKNRTAIQEDYDVYIINDCPKEIEDIKLYLDTIPEKNDFHIKKKNSEQDLELYMEDGNIKELRVDGTIIPKSDYKSHEKVIEILKPDSSREVITVFPHCGEDFGNIYFLNKNREVFELDSILKNYDLKLKDFEDSHVDLFDSSIDKFDNDFIDSLKGEIKTFDWDKVFEGKKMKLDSIVELLGSKSLQIQKFNFPDQFSHSLDSIIPESLSQSFLSSREPPLIGGEEDVFERFRPFHYSRATMSVADKICAELLEDKFIESDKEAKIELSGKSLKINGEKQPSNIWKKYKGLYEELTEIKMTKKSNVEIIFDPSIKEEVFKHKWLFN